MRLGSSVAVAVVQAGSCSSDSTPSLGTSICCGCGPEKKKKKPGVALHQFLLRRFNEQLPLVVSRGLYWHNFISSFTKESDSR